MTVRIKIDPTSLAALIAANPDVTVELEKFAADAVAAQIIRKVDSGRMAQDVIENINRQLRQYNIPAELRKSIDGMIDKLLQDRISRLADIAVHNAISDKVKNLDGWTSALIEKRLDAMIMQKVSAAIAAAANLKA
jgi:uncharacterized membrane protein YheB (UPF0754 family)